VPPTATPSSPVSSGTDGPERFADGSAIVFDAVEPFTGDLPEIRKRGELRVLVPYNHTEFYVSRGSPHGYVYETMMAAQKFLNRKVPRKAPHLSILFVPTPTERLLPDLLAGRGDVAAGLLLVTPERREVVSFTRPIVTGVDEIVVRHADAPALASLDDLAGKTVHVLAGTSLATHLRDLDRRLVAAGKAAIRIVELPPPATREAVLRMVDDGDADYAVATDLLARLWSGVLPGLRLQPELTLASDEAIAWAVRPGNPQLLAALDAFLSQKGREATLAAAVQFQRYYQSLPRLRGALQKDSLARIGEHAPHFREAGERFGFDWLLLGAQAFQESGLDPAARNPTGAVGLMQVMPSTGAQMGYPDVEKPRANVLAGSAYLRHLRDEWFADPAIPPEDRIYFALAAYNAGPGAIGEMRRRAKRAGLDPNRWFGNVEIVVQQHIGDETPGYISNIHRYYLVYKLSPPVAP
jgi:membrane-bound lytic murein transglycosylase MltF